MTSSAIRATSIVKGLPYLSMVMLGAFGCSAEAPPQGSTEAPGVVQQAAWSPRVCGGAGARECGASETCLPFIPNGCPAPTHIGLCIPRPAHCPAVNAPVCGCDGTTYSNLCEAARGGAAVEHRGACAAAPKCGGTTSGACPGAGRCVDDPTTSCDTGDDRHHSTGHGDRDDGWDRDGRGDCDDAPGRRGHGGERGCTKVCQCGAVQQCAAGEQWNDDPAVCACQPSAATCATLTCKSGDVCLTRNDGTALCVADGCVGITCRAGDVCTVQSDGTAACIADPCASVTCKAGAQCVVEPGGTAACR